MPRFIVTGEMTISVHTEVEADTMGEAIKIADGRPAMGPCYHCARSASEESEEEWRTSGELDGMPVNLRAEEL